MKAHTGDQIVVRGVHVGMPERIGVITEVSHADGTPPYRVRWLDDGHETMVFPGPDAQVRPPADQPS